MRKYVICFVAALFFAYELVQFHMMNAISSVLMRDLHMTATEFGQLCATYLLADVIFLLPAGMLLDRFSIRKVILVALTLCIGGTIGFSFAMTGTQASLCHFLSGIGNAFCVLPCMMLVARLFPQEKHATMMGLVVTIGMMGAFLAQYPVSLLAHLFTWRAALLLDGAAGLVLLGAIYALIPDTERRKTDLVVWPCINRQNLLCGLYTSLMNMPLMVLGAVWGCLFLTQVHGMAWHTAAFTVSLISMGTIVGSPLVGLFQQRRQVMAIGALLAFVIMVLIMWLPKAPFALLFFLLGLVTSTQILGYPLITDHSPQALTGTSMGVAAVVIMGLPMLVQPLSGFLLDLNWAHTMQDGAPLYTHANFITAFSLFPLGFVIALLSLPFIMERKLCLQSSN